MRQKTRNIIIYLVLTLLVFLFAIIKLINLQAIEGVKYSTFSANLALKNIDGKPPRGIIADKNLVILAKNSELYDLDIANLAANEKEVFQNLGLKLNSSTNITNLSNKQVFEIINNPKFNGFDYKIILKNVRDYLFPYEFSHIIGYTGVVDSNDVKNGYAIDDYLGKYKIESQFENELKGQKGSVTNTGSTYYDKKSEPGNNIQLTIDKNWQVSLYKILGNANNEYNAAGAAGVIIDNSNGNIISMVSYPGFDTNLFSTGLSNDQYQSLLIDRNNPLQDKAIGVADAPGSTFKIITAYNLLENNIVDVNSRFFSNRCLSLGSGYDFCEFGKFFYGDMNIVRALYKSSNVFFCNYELKDYSQNQFSGLFNSASLFNIGNKTGVNLTGEVSGNMDSPDYKKRINKEEWFDGDTCNSAIGQGAIQTTPLQMAMVASAISNDGVYYKPNLIEKISDVYGNVIEESKPEVLRTIPIKEETLELIKEGMYNVAHNPEGTVYVFLKNTPGNVMVKTGTAEVYENIDGKQVYKTHGWIIGSFDFEGKSYSFAFHLRYGGGGFYIAKVARDFIGCVYNNFNGCL